MDTFFNTILIIYPMIHIHLYNPIIIYTGFLLIKNWIYKKKKKFIIFQI